MGKHFQEEEKMKTLHVYNAVSTALEIWLEIDTSGWKIGKKKQTNKTNKPKT